MIMGLYGDHYLDLAVWIVGSIVSNKINDRQAGANLEEVSPPRNGRGILRLPWAKALYRQVIEYKK